MYLNEQSTTSDSDRVNGIILRPWERIYLPQALGQTGLGSSHSFGLGETPAPPKGLVLLDHVQIPKRPDAASPGKFVTGSLAKLVVSDMNPGFIDASDNLITDTSSNGLQTCLQKLITSQFQNYLSNKSNTSPAPGDRLRVALVDLTGNKISKPEFAGWGSTVAMYAASSAKVLAVYAAHQLRMDVRNIASTQKISDGKILERTALQTWKLASGPNLNWLFEIRSWSGTPASLNFSVAARDAIAGIMHNEHAADLITNVGFPHIASVTWQSGLFHPKRGGLWLTGSYGKGGWRNNPIPGVMSANITALSAATFFTLLAQGRLVDDASSADISNSLNGGCITWLFPIQGVVASKCGIWSDYLHDCALIRHGSIRYVVVGLTRTQVSERQKYQQLFLELDKLIVQNNQSPKPAC